MRSSRVSKDCCQPCVECKVVCLTSVKELALYHWKWLLCHGSWGSIIPSRLWTTDRSSGGGGSAAEQVQGLEEDFKRTPRGSMIHGGTPKKVQIRRKMRLLSPLHADQPAHDNGVPWFLQEDSYFQLPCKIRYDTIRYNTIQCFAMRRIGKCSNDMIWWDMILYDTIR